MMKTQTRYLVEFSCRHELYYFDKDCAIQTAKELTKNVKCVKVKELVEKILEYGMVERIKEIEIDWRELNEIK